MNPTWWQRRSAFDAMGTVLAAWTLWVAIQSWAVVDGTDSAGGIARLLLNLAFAVVMGFVVLRQVRASTWEANQRLRAALRDGHVAPGTPTAGWADRLRALVRQYSAAAWTLGMAYLGLLGGPFLALSFGARAVVPLVAAAGIGVVVGAVVGALTLPLQRRTRDSAVVLLKELEA